MAVCSFRGLARRSTLAPSSVRGHGHLPSLAKPVLRPRDTGAAARRPGAGWQNDEGTEPLEPAMSQASISDDAPLSPATPIVVPAEVVELVASEVNAVQDQQQQQQQAEEAPHTKHQRHMRRKTERLKVQLLAALSSLDRGLAANPREASEVDSLCSELEGLMGPVSLGWDPAAAGSGDEPVSSQQQALRQLPGTWRLVYSSGFNTGSLGGRRPGPPAALFPAVLGQVYQRIDPETSKLDNIVELLFNYGLPSPASLLNLLPGSPAERRPARSDSAWDSPALRLTLSHSYEITGTSGVRITYEETFAELVGSSMFSSLPRLQAPSLPEALRPPKPFRSAVFDVTYLDTNMRITRGDRGELRVFLRDDANAPAITGQAPSAAELDYND